MKLFGLTEHSLKWFRSYLTIRIQVSNVDLVQSKQNSIKYGVPEVSTLGLFLFLFMLMIYQIASLALLEVCCIHKKQINNRS